MLQEQTTLPNGAIIQDHQGESYVVEALLGRGGFSGVYRVRDRRMKQKVFALKEIIDPKPQERRNLAFEAELLMRLNHSSLPHVYQVFENVKLNRIFTLMDYIEGKDLETLRREQPELRFPLTLALMLMAPIIEAVSYLHKQQPPVVHRDIKPANIIVPTGGDDAFLVDFGLAKEFVEDKTTGAFRYGTPGYAAPEQYGRGTNLRTDIYALAATLYTLLTGVVPVDALTRSINSLGSDPLKRAHEVCPAIPEAVAVVIERAMSLRHEDRFPNVDEFWQALCIAAVQQNVTVPAIPLIPTRPGNVPTPIPVVQNKGLSRKQKTWLVIISAIILIAAAIDSTFMLMLKSRAIAPIHAVSASIVQKTTITTNTCALPANAPPPSSPYPQLASCYEGTLNDSGITNEQTSISLSAVKQQQNQISGSFAGLQQSGSFAGTITKNGEITFLVHLNALPEKEILSFEGNFNVGYIRGTFDGYYVNSRQPTGDYGDWTLEPPAPRT